MTEQEYDLSEGCCTPGTLQAAVVMVDGQPFIWRCDVCGEYWWLVGDTYYQDPQDAIGRSES